MKEKPVRVFISFCDQDRQFAEQLYHVLTARKIGTFCRSLSAAEMTDIELWATIEDAIDKCEHMVVIARTLESLKSAQIQKETGMFLVEEVSGRKQGNLITMIFGEMKIDQLPIRYRSSQVILFNPENDFQELVDFLKKPFKYYPWVRTV
jgi:hypothetical protein